ncbi:glutathione S-transferase C-terminal domain-containing protein isoform X4 [Dasypus novemcinctus]|uniref:glutathione S-transferase C-terminal domain-containing protein isoform X4 n=1 Tax=Dasypus novemcinctus TaxID=9361 RepID=UPI0003291CB2|nr:glutathione S-transferase C-terminal domain-containing protein isoform X4 [Dasypus novemcinctus]
MTAGPSNYEEALCAISLPAPGRRVVCQPLFARAASESRLRRGGKALAIRVTDTYTHPPCLAAPLRPGKEGARAAELPAPKALQPLLEASGSSGLRMRVKGGKGDGVELVSGSSPALQLPRVLWTQLSKVSQWTRLCELTIPLAIENFLRESSEQPPTIPVEIRQLEKKLSEPVRVHNDDKLRRQKLKQQKAAGVGLSLAKEKTKNKVHKLETSEDLTSEPNSLELEVAFSKLTIQEEPATTNREPSHIRKAKTSDLPPLEHVFAEGLYFTLADIVLLPCIHHFLVIICKKLSEKLVELPLLASWYQRIQKVPRVKTAASKCRIHFLHLSDLLTPMNEQHPNISEVPGVEEKNDPSFIGGPRPTMTKLMENGIEVMFSPHPCPTWTVDWNNLPAAVSPKEGKMSSDRALRKQQQLNNLVYVVTNQAKPGDRIVDFCSGGGHVGIVLAHMLPLCQVILIENKELSLVHAKKRSEKLGLSNIWFIQANMEYFTGNFNIGVALHACGVATDMVIEHCIKTRASFVTCPCCYGFIQNTSKCNFPKSEQFKEILSYKEHMILCRFADQTAVQLPSQRRLIGKQCMCLVDLDRARAAEEHGYSVQVISMEPESCSPKNNMIVGVPT